MYANINCNDLRYLFANRGLLKLNRCEILQQQKKTLR